MKERPIIFSTEMVRAILEGQKTQTRRVIKPQPEWKTQNKHFLYKGWAMTPETLIREHCPYGQVGDRLWVRETWRVVGFMDGEPLYLEYKDGFKMEDRSSEIDPPNYEEAYEKLIIQCAEDCEKAGLVPDEAGIYRWAEGQAPTRWRPSIFMPRWASRITREITEVRAERLQDITCGGYITKSDVQREGCPFETDWQTFGNQEIEWFKEYWDSLNAKRGYSWEGNPWVGVISFRRVDNAIT